MLLLLFAPNSSGKVWFYSSALWRGMKAFVWRKFVFSEFIIYLVSVWSFFTHQVTAVSADSSCCCCVCFCQSSAVLWHTCHTFWYKYRYTSALVKVEEYQRLYKIPQLNQLHKTKSQQQSSGRKTKLLYCPKIHIDHWDLLRPHEPSVCCQIYKIVSIIEILVAFWRKVR